jgi:hypothetical protein
LESAEVRRNVDMGRRPRTLVASCVAVIFVFGFIYWLGIAAPRKEVLFKTEMVKSIDTGEVYPSYNVFYKWNGIEQQYPWWILLKLNGEWKVARLKDLITNKDKEEAQRSFVRFDIKWINEYRFSPQSTRYETMLLLLGAQPMYEDEQAVFYAILDQIRKYEKQ